MRKLIFTILFILFLQQATAIGIVTSVMENNTLNLIEGHSTRYEIQIQNTDEEMSAKVSLSSDIAYIIDPQEEYLLPAGVSHTPVYFNITAPEDAKPGDEYTLSYSVQPLTAKGGSIKIAIALNKNFKIKIIEDPNKPIQPKKSYTFEIIIASLLLISAIVIYVKKYK